MSKALNFFALFRSFESPTSTFVHLLGSLNTLLYDLIAITPGLALFPLTTSTLAAELLFSSEREPILF